MDLNILKIDLKGLSEGLNKLEFDLDNTYFKAINASEVSGGSVHVSLADCTHTERLFHARFLRERNGCIAMRHLLGRYGTTYRDTTAT